MASISRVLATSIFLKLGNSLHHCVCAGPVLRPIVPTSNTRKHVAHRPRETIRRTMLGDLATTRGCAHHGMFRVTCHAQTHNIHPAERLHKNTNGCTPAPSVSFSSETSQSSLGTTSLQTNREQIKNNAPLRESSVVRSDARVVDSCRYVLCSRHAPTSMYYHLWCYEVVKLRSYRDVEF